MTADLITRLESADGPSRELDADIARAIGWECVVRDPEAQGKYVCWRKHYRSGEWIMLPRYTASIDAALTLVPEGWDWAIFHTNGGLTIHAWCGDKIDHFGDTPALALCIAALRAHQKDTNA